jgi:hypothetical protein
MRNSDNIENHMVLNATDAPWNQPDAPEESAVERMEREKTEDAAKKRNLLVESLHNLADFLEERTDVELPRVLTFNYYYSIESFLGAAALLAKGGKIEKTVDPETATYPMYHVVRWFGVIKLEYDIPRQTICRLVSPAVYDCPDSLLRDAAWADARTASEAANV